MLVIQSPCVICVLVSVCSTLCRQQFLCICTYIGWASTSNIFSTSWVFIVHQPYLHFPINIYNFLNITVINLKFYTPMYVCIMHRPMKLKLQCQIFSFGWPYLFFFIYVNTSLTICHGKFNFYSHRNMSLVNISMIYFLHCNLHLLFWAIM